MKLRSWSPEAMRCANWSVYELFFSFFIDNQKVKSIIVTEVTVMSPFIMYSSQNPYIEFFRYGSDNDKRRWQVFKSFSIKIDTGYLSSIRTRNSTRDNIIYKCYNKKFRRKLFCHLLFRVRKRRSQSVLPGRFSVLKSCLLWVPQCICLGSYKACSKNFCAGAGRDLNFKS